MAAFDRNTGQLITGQDERAQDVLDRVTTPRGSRVSLPAYGTYLNDLYTRPLPEIEASVVESQALVPGHRSISFTRQGALWTISIVNDLSTVTVTAG